ncbi:MAG: rod shape-determining protein MreC [Paludibacteraceae bacterium]|nr:rod shape-determining protein MreC [Paludibacteraceae bacterium]
MNNLLKFFIRFHVFFLFLLLETGCVVMLIASQNYQQSVFLSSANGVVARLYSASNSVIEFFRMKGDNARLAEENSHLLNRINELENELTEQNERLAGIEPVFAPAENELRYISAKVINLTTNRLKNYITINKGSRDGIEPGMGVVSPSGAVGVVKNVSEKFAVIVPILNPDFQLNCRFKKNDYVGPLVWNGIDYRYAALHDIARHVEVQDGDTLVTSGLTATFPKGVMVGTVESSKLSESDAYYDIKVELAVNFRTLTYVQVIKNANINEQRQLESMQ